MIDDDRYSRHVGLFGVEGQARLARTTVAVVGVGGLGSHVVQQLAYLGVKSFFLIDRDAVSASNLNRLIGATEEHVGMPKVDVAAELVKSIQHDGDVRRLQAHFEAANAPSELETVHVLFGCVDVDPPRLDLVRFASAFGRPYIDLATDVPPDGEFGGRVIFAKDGERCLSCLNELDQHELARGQMTEEQRAADDTIYGIDRAALGATGPSVVSVNGAVASLAVTEFLVWVTGLRQPMGYLSYRGDRGTVGVRADPERAYCHYCMTKWGTRTL